MWITLVWPAWYRECCHWFPHQLQFLAVRWHFPVTYKGIIYHSSYSGGYAICYGWSLLCEVILPEKQQNIGHMRSNRFPEINFCVLSELRKNVFVQHVGAHRKLRVSVETFLKEWTHPGQSLAWKYEYYYINVIGLTHPHNRFQTATVTERSISGRGSISPKTIRNRLCGCTFAVL